jgi:hypothetical protein
MLSRQSSQRFLIILSAITFLTGSAHSQSWLTNGLVAYYPLNGNANDASGNTNHGTVVNAVSAANRFGTTNGCFSFSGNAQYIYAAADNLPTGQRTIALWFKVNQVANRPQFLGYGGSSCGDSFFMGLNHYGVNSYDIATHCGIYELSVPFTTPPTNAWHHWVAVMDNAGLTIYIDGQFIGSRSGTTTTFVAGRQLGLGVLSGPTGTVPYTDSNVGYLDGFLDDVRFYNRAFSTNEVAQLYAFESAPPFVMINKVDETVGLSFSNLIVGANYQVQVSTNLNYSFTNHGAPFPATDSSMHYPSSWNVDERNSLFFHVQLVP